MLKLDPLAYPAILTSKSQWPSCCSFPSPNLLGPLGWEAGKQASSAKQEFHLSKDIFNAWKHHNAKQNVLLHRCFEHNLAGPHQKPPKVADPKLCGCSCPEQEAMGQPEDSSTTFILGGFRYELLLQMILNPFANPAILHCSLNLNLSSQSLLFKLSA